MLEDPILGGSHTSRHSFSDSKIATVMHVMAQGHFSHCISLAKIVMRTEGMTQWRKGLVYKERN